MTYTPPDTVPAVLRNIEFEAPLAAGDPRYVETTSARGSEKTFDRLARKLGLYISDDIFEPPLRKHILFFGHTGSGKTTELRHYAARLGGPERYVVIEVGIAEQLDRNNFQYTDILMALAEALFARLVEAKVDVSDDALAGLRTWFVERVRTQENVNEFVASLEAGAQTSLGIPFFARLFSKFVAAFKTNVTYKDSLRTVVRNTYSEYAQAFNAFLRGAESAIDRACLGKRVLFVIDGADKLRGSDRRGFFVEDAEQLLSIDANVVYTAPLSLKYEGNLTNGLDSDLVLPMIRLEDGERNAFPSGREAMRSILVARAAAGLFASEDEIDRLIDFSGGHPRELLRLLKLCCEHSESTKEIDAAAVGSAVKTLASEYRRFLTPTDYECLVQVDRDQNHLGNDERLRGLLFNLAVLEYNDGSWRRSHPVVRELEGYRQAAKRHDGSA